MMQVDENVVFVGRKTVKEYMAAVFTLFAQGHTEVELKARGKNVYNAIRVALAVKNKLGSAAIEKVEIDEEEYERDGKKRNVPTITIKLVKQ